MKKPTYSGRFPLFVGCSALIVLLLGIGVWSVRTEIAGAIIASGTIVVENNRQVIQHAEGGVVGEILARDGDPISEGDLLLRLDGTILESELALAELQLIELRARKARLQAERDEASDIIFPKDLLALDTDAATEQIEGQRKLFEARRNSLETERKQIAEQIKQIHNQSKVQKHSKRPSRLRKNWSATSSEIRNRCWNAALSKTNECRLFGAMRHKSPGRSGC